MKEISIKIDDGLYRRAARKVDNLEAEVNQRVTEYLESVNGGDDNIVAARARMAELFNQTTDFSVGVRPAREQLQGR